jgi:hypothetical protein
VKGERPIETNRGLSQGTYPDYQAVSRAITPILRMTF